MEQQTTSARIRLIASDMDGTLLTDEKQLPPDFLNTVRALRARGILFVIGSGRTFTTLQRDFSDLMGEMDFLCDNGSYVVENGVNTFVSVLPPQAVTEMVRIIESIGPRVRPVLCGKNGVYAREYRNDADLEKNMIHSFSQFVPCEDLCAVGDDICKVAICDPDGIAATTLPALVNAFGDAFQVVQSGPLYADITNKGVSKGTALAHLQRAHGISREETMVFGDYSNDIEMLNCAQYSFLMENAAPDMTPYGNYRAPSNNAFGVQEIICRHVLERMPMPPPVRSLL